MSDPRIVCVGSIIYDLMSYVPRLPKPGESLLGCKIVSANGGKGANSIIAASRLGGNALMIGKIGTDSASCGIMANFMENKINTEFVFQTSEASTGMAIVIIEKHGENRIIVAGGANTLLSPDEVVTAENAIKRCKVMTANFEVNIKACKTGLNIAKKHGLTTILNAAPAFPNPDPDFYSLPDIFCLNETEAEIITGIDAAEVNYQAIIAELFKRGCNNVVLTLGEKGVLLRTNTSPVCIPIKANKIKAVDSTGAGDAFVGSLAYYLAYHSELALKEQVRRAAVYASLSVERPGTQSSYPTRNEVPEELFK